MKILESPLMGAFIAYMMASWSRRSRVGQSRRRLENLVAMVRAVADDAEARPGAAVRDDSISRWLRLLRARALRGQQVLDAAGTGRDGGSRSDTGHHTGSGGDTGRDAGAVAWSGRSFLDGLRTLFTQSSEVDRLTEAVEELERLAAPGADLDRFIGVFGRRRRRGGDGAADMDVDGPPEADARLLLSEASGSAVAAGAGAKRKRACSSCVDPGASMPDEGVDTAVVRQRRRVLPRTMRHPAGLGGRRAAPREQAPAGAAGSSPDDRARAVALAMARVRRRIGKPTTRRRQAILGEHFSRFSL
ncbi:unnamed protein product [Urochloa decumbens]|uniref:Rx N-terminal domain-containing protein n=1 Tax=Urochloa decumbens TaxID=240449 RepID=A0ABC8Z434_9POAL